MFNDALVAARHVLEEAALRTDLRSPMAAVLHRCAGDPPSLIAYWQERSAGSRLSDARYRWELLDERAGGSAYVPAVLTPWRPRDVPRLRRDPKAFELRLTLPIALAEGVQLLAESDLAEAAALLRETEPIARADLASFIRGTHAWTDTFALFCLARCPRALERMRPFALGIAAAYAPLSERGHVLGTRFPFHDRPLVSASAMLASGLYALGAEIPLVGRLTEWVSSQSDGGRFGDDDQPPEVMTTALATDLLSRLEPRFEPADSLAFLVSQQAEDGWFRALGPEAPWLTVLVLELLTAASLPFASRFVWPAVPDADLDRKTRLRTFGAFVDLSSMFEGIGGLAAAPVEMAFVDLVGFRAFNNRFGQRMGDAVLEAFASQLEEIAECVAVRDGGDEFLLVGAPTGAGLGARIEAFRDTWPSVFERRFGVDAPPVSARWLTTTVSGARLRDAREALGRAVGEMKPVDASGPRGIRRHVPLV